MGKGTGRVSRRNGYLNAAHEEHNEAPSLDYVEQSRSAPRLRRGSVTPVTRCLTKVGGCYASP